MNYAVYVDGGARGNPGPAAAAAIIEGQPPLSKFLGRATNNQAEYQAVLLAIEHFVNERVKLKPSFITIYLDSELVAEQLNGRYRVKHPDLKPLHWRVRELVLQLGGRVSFRHIARSENKLADQLVNQTIDRHER